MIKRLRKIFLISVFFAGMFLSNLGTIAIGDPIVGEIFLNPEKPKMQSDVTFTVDISGDSISSVQLVLSECNKDTGLCHISRNISMSKKSGDTYEAKIPLEWDDVNSINYKISLESNGKWIQSEEHTTYLALDSDGSSDSNDSPGFELIVFIIAIMSFILLFKKSKLN